MFDMTPLTWASLYLFGGVLFANGSHKSSKQRGKPFGYASYFIIVVCWFPMLLALLIKRTKRTK